MHFFIYLQWLYRNHIKRDTYLILLFFFCFSITLRKLIQSAITLIESVSCFCNNYFCFVSNTNFTKLFWTLPWVHLWPPEICWCLISYFISYCLIRNPFERSWIKMEHLITVRHGRGKKFFVIQAALQQVFIVFITDIIHEFTFYLYFSSSSPDAALQSAHLPLLLHSSSHNFPGIREYHNPTVRREVHAVHEHHHQTLPRPHLMLYLTFKPKDQHSNHRKSSSNTF